MLFDKDPISKSSRLFKIFSLLRIIPFLKKINISLITSKKDQLSANCYARKLFRKSCPKSSLEAVCACESKLKQMHSNYIQTITENFCHQAKFVSSVEKFCLMSLIYLKLISEHFRSEQFARVLLCCLKMFVGWKFRH